MMFGTVSERNSQLHIVIWQMHDFQGRIMAGMHVHLDHDHCLEVLVARGKGAAIRKVADALLSVKGVKHGKLTMTTTGKGLSL